MFDLLLLLLCFRLSYKYDCTPRALHTHSIPFGVVSFHFGSPVIYYIVHDAVSFRWMLYIYCDDDVQSNRYAWWLLWCAFEKYCIQTLFVPKNLFLQLFSFSLFLSRSSSRSCDFSFRFNTPRWCVSTCCRLPLKICTVHVTHVSFEWSPVECRLWQLILSLNSDTHLIYRSHSMHFDTYFDYLSISSHSIPRYISAHSCIQINVSMEDTFCERLYASWTEERSIQINTKLSIFRLRIILWNPNRVRSI